MTAGWIRRVLTSLTSNVAETAEDSPFPELRVPAFQLSASLLYEAALEAVRTLHWEISRQNPVTLQVHAVVTSRMFRFKDDVHMRVKELGNGGCRLLVRSASRTGMGDLGANRRHIAELVETLKSGAVLSNRTGRRHEGGSS